MPSVAIVSRVIGAQPFDNAGTQQMQVQWEVFLTDISGAKATTTHVAVNVSGSDTGAQINANIQAAVVAQAAALGYSIAANATVIPQFTRL